MAYCSLNAYNYKLTQNRHTKSLKSHSRLQVVTLNLTWDNEIIMEIIINYTEHEYQDAYVEPRSGEPVYTSYVEFELNKATDECLEGYKCESVEVTKGTLPYKGEHNELNELFIVVCRFNNLAANIFEDWDIVGCYTSEEEAVEVAEDIFLHTDRLKGLSDSLILLYCDTHPLLFEKV